MDGSMDYRPIILLMDADEAFARSVREFLQGHGCRVEVCNRADVGLALAAELEPDVVVTEMLLPGASGFRVLEHLKRRDASLPVIMAATFGSAVQRSLARTLGADDFLAKPVSLNRLLESVRRFCSPGVNPPH